MRIIIDTREKNPWTFPGLESVTKKLDTGDYSIEGLEDVVCIERKKSTSEVAQNIGKDWKRFSKELDRLKLIPFTFLICEFPIEYVHSFPENSGIPKNKIQYSKISSQFISSRLSQMNSKYGVRVIYSNGPIHAEMIARHIFEDIINSYVVSGNSLKELEKKYPVNNEFDDCDF